MARDADKDREQLLEEVSALRAELEKLRGQASSDALERSEASLRNAQRIAHLGHWDSNLETGVLSVRQT